MKTMLLAVGVALMGGAAFAQTADEIMERVAENQTRTQEQRSSFVYHQNVLVRLKRANGKVAREETHDFTVTPTPDGIRKERVHFSGKYEKSGKLIDYSDPGYKYKGLDIDGEIVEEMAKEFTDDKEARDGIARDMFPLRKSEIDKYKFRLAGTESVRGHDVYRIEFEPSGKRDIDDACWAGEALIDKAEYQPVMISTHLACKIPALVKTLLGTDVKQVGAKVTYEKFADGLWFPVTYGSELKLRAIFVYARSMAIGVINSEFQRASVDSKIAFDKVSGAAEATKPPSQP